jgi:hypothetical protein
MLSCLLVFVYLNLAKAFLRDRVLKRLCVLDLDRRDHSVLSELHRIARRQF